MIPDYTAVLTHVRHASEAFGLCKGLVSDTGSMTEDHRAVIERGGNAITKLAEAAMGITPAE